MKYFKIIFLVCGVILLCLAIYQYSKDSTTSPNLFNLIEKKPTTILVFGDMMLDRNVRRLIELKGEMYPFQNILEELKTSDISVANLEGVFTKNDSISVKDNTVLRFTFDKKYINTIWSAGFDILSQANNHTFDFGRDGILESKQALSDVGIQTFGDYFNEKTEATVLLRNEKKIAFIGFNEFSYQNLAGVIESIKKAKETSDYVIVMPHWGIEYQNFPSNFQKNKAYAFVDAGADAVIGAHPHVIQPIEIYKNKPIFYSLGNFVFDQNFSKETTEGLAVRISIYNDRNVFELKPFNIISSQVSFKDMEEKDKTLKWLSDNSSVSEIVSEEIRMGKFEIVK